MHSMGWNGCGDGETIGCGTHPTEDGGNFWIPGGCATAYDDKAGISAIGCTSGYYASVCAGVGISGGDCIYSTAPGGSVLPVCHTLLQCGVATSPVAELPGPPKDNVPCASNDQANSLPVGATVGIANVNGADQVRSVADINRIDGYNTAVRVSGSVLYIGTKTIGWVYEDDHGGFWFQGNANLSWTYSFTGGVTVGDIISGAFGINSPPGKSAVPIGSKPGTIPQHSVAEKCFKDGSAFFPGTLG